jgi:hypothetical protein
MKLNIQIDKNEFKKNFFAVLVPELNKYLVGVISKVRPEIGNIIKHAILDSPEVQSLFGGKLQAELGVIDPQIRMLSIVDILASNSNLTFSPVKVTNNYARASIELNYIRSDYADILSQQESFQLTANGSVLNWLEWLLLKGDEVIVFGWDVGTDPLNLSRTGLGTIMYKGRARSWSVPPEFSGSQFDNFITRSLNNIQKQVEDAFNRALI